MGRVPLPFQNGRGLAQAGLVTPEQGEPRTEARERNRGFPAQPRRSTRDQDVTALEGPVREDHRVIVSMQRSGPTSSEADAQL